MCALHDIDLIIAEDDTVFRTLLAVHFETRGYRVRAVGDAASALEASRARVPDAILLDVGLGQGATGVEVCAGVRAIAGAGPVIVLVSQRCEDLDRLLGLGAGADGYVAKPTRPRVVEAYLKAALRRQAPVPRRARLRIQPHSVVFDGRLLDLTETERKILCALDATPSGTLCRDDLLDQVWGSSCSGWRRNVDAHVARLRRKLRRAGVQAGVVETVHGFGYRLSAAVRGGLDAQP